MGKTDTRQTVERRVPVVNQTPGVHEDLFQMVQENTPLQGVVG